MLLDLNDFLSDPEQVSISALSDRGLLLYHERHNKALAKLFQYPLFRIVDCFLDYLTVMLVDILVSISALSDRGLLQECHRAAIFLYKMFQYPLFRIVDCFWRLINDKRAIFEFQYPLFRIVDCFAAGVGAPGRVRAFQYPLFRIVDCFYSLGCMTMRSWCVSISALSDRGLLLSAENRHLEQNC